MTQEDILHIKEDGLNAPLEEERGNYGHKGPFWYFTTHGVQPGSIPNDVHIIEIRDGVNNKGTKGTFVALDGVLTAEELKYYDMKEMSPRFMENESLNESSFTRDTFKVKDGDSEIVISYEWDKDNTWHTTVGEFKDGFQVGALWFNKYYPTEEQAKNSFNRQKYLLKKLYPESVKAKTIKEDLTNSEDIKIKIRPISGVHSDGFNVYIYNKDKLIDEKDYRYGYNATSLRDWADAKRPFVKDIVEKIAKEYNLTLDDIEYIDGRYIFDNSVYSGEKFKHEFMSESLKENGYKNGDRYYGGLPSESSYSDYADFMDSRQNRMEKFIKENNIKVYKRMRDPGTSLPIFTRYSGKINGHSFIFDYVDEFFSDYCRRLVIDGKEVDKYKSDLWKTNQVDLFTVQDILESPEKLSKIVFKNPSDESLKESEENDGHYTRALKFVAEKIKEKMKEYGFDSFEDMQYRFGWEDIKSYIADYLYEYKKDDISLYSTGEITDSITTLSWRWVKNTLLKLLNSKDVTLHEKLENYQVLSTSDIDLSDNVDDEGIDLYYKQWKKLQKELAPKERNLYILVVDDYDVPSPHYYSVAKLDKQTKDYLIYDVNGVKVGFTDKGTESPWLWFASEEDANKYVDAMNAENESLNMKSNKKDLREAMRYWFTFDDGTEIPAENEEQAIELYARLWKNRRPKQVRSKEELDKIAQSLYDKRNDEGFYDFNDEELAILWSMCVLRKDGTGGRAYDDEIYDTINLLPHKQSIFDRAEEIVDEEEKSFLTKEQNDKLDKAISDVVKATEQPKKTLKESPDDEIKIFMNTWANYNENGADISQYGFENMADGWLSIDDAIEFAEKYADDEPFINDTDNVPAGFDINEYSSIDVLNDLKKYEELSSYDKEALSAIMEATGDDFESAKEILDSGDYTFYKGIDNFTDLAYEIIDELGGLEEALGDRVSNYIDEDAMRRAYEWDIRDSMRDDAENAVEEDHYGELTTDDFDNLPKEVELDIELSDYDDEDELNDAIRDEIAYNLDLDFDVDDLETAIESFDIETTEDGKTIAKNIVYNFETYDKDAEIEDWIDNNIDSYLDSIIEEEIYLAEKGEVDLSDYFDYEAYGRDLSYDGTFTIVDGGIIELY